MTDLEKVARMALEKVQEFKSRWWKVPPFGNKLNKAQREAITFAHVPVFELEEALRQATSNSVEQPAQQEPFKPDWVNYRQGVEDGRAEALEMLAKQEPVGQLMEEAYGRGQVLWFDKPDDFSMLYTSPQPSKPWVGLTQQDIDIAFDDTQEGGGFDEFARAIEAKLKEKNT
jgi:hypothetical protein